MTLGAHDKCHNPHHFEQGDTPQSGPGFFTQLHREKFLLVTISATDYSIDICAWSCAFLSASEGDEESLLWVERGLRQTERKQRQRKAHY